VVANPVIQSCYAGVHKSRRVVAQASSTAGTSDEQAIISRRDQLLVAAALALAGPAAAIAGEGDAQLYSDEKDKFTIAVPASWVGGSGDLTGAKNSRFSNSEGLQRVVAWFPKDKDGQVNVAVTVTTVGPDVSGALSIVCVQGFVRLCVSVGHLNADNGAASTSN
jgi:hypothetical protein